MSALKRAASLVSWRRIWGPAITLLGLAGQFVHWGWLSLDILGRLDVLWRVVESMGGNAAIVAGTIASWQFSFALIVVGLAYTIFVGEPEKGVQRHPWWPYVAASLFTVCLTTMISVALYGEYEIQLRKAYSAGASGIPRATSPASLSVDGNQRPLYTGNRSLTPNQQRLLIEQGGRIHSDLTGMSLTFLDTDMETYAYASTLKATFARAAIQSTLSAQQLEDPTRSGVMIQVRDKNMPPEKAVKLQQLLLVADIQATFVEVPTYNSTQFLLFVGPQPIQR